jgi:putative ABC transport system permease protein
MDVVEGTFFSEADDFTHTRVAVIGSDAKKKLFSGQNALGENLRLDGISYQIVGVLKHQVQNGDGQHQRARLCSLQRHERSD